MTLSPVFRSPEAVRLLEEHGIWQRLNPAIVAQAQAVQTVRADLAAVIGEEFRRPVDPVPAEPDAAEGNLDFLQEFFFLILFRALFESLGIAPRRLPFYAEMNFCIKGTITAADNIFDDQDKSLLPLKRNVGPRCGSILQLMCFERLIRRACDRAVSAGAIEAEPVDTILRGLIDRMARIGQLEGSEEGGVKDIPPPPEMIERVHAVRGGALFSLAFVAPRAIETGEVGERVRRAEPAIARLGTAFQIVDDLTDFEFDLRRRSHNLLVSQITHHGTPIEREKLRALWSGQPAEDGLVEGLFRPSAQAALEMARAEARASLAALEELGFWFPSALADPVVHAIVGHDGTARIKTLVSSAGRGTK